MVDAHYTPPEIAQQMIAGLPVQFSPHSIADFACGDGVLLSEASKLWPESQFIANDINANLIRKLRRANNGWSLSTVDFLSENSLRRSKLISLQQEIDCILINPPFSERGRVKIVSEFFGAQVTAGSTMTFLLRALRFLAPRGYMVAILPDSCFISQRDRAAWDRIKMHFAVQKTQSNPRSTFKGIAASTTIAILHHHIGRNAPLSAKPLMYSDLEIFRGKLQMHALEKWASVDGYPLVHTANLTGNRVNLLGCYTVNFRHVVEGPAILVPRVGAVTREKVAVLPECASVVLSDCVLAIKSKTDNNVALICQAILEQWNTFRTAYAGTGAPYTTLERISEVLSICIKAQKVVNASPEKDPMSNFTNPEVFLLQH